jgi:3',5'-cyclic-AMP phosphodiesterase
MLLSLPLHVVQISDTHLFAEPSRELLGLSTTESLTTVVEAIRRLQPQPDVLLLTGDLSQDESPQSYERLRHLIAPLGIPSYWLPGNHDDLPLMEQILCSGSISANKVFQIKGWNLMLLNSMVAGKVYGELTVDSLSWLEQQLQQRPHHPTLIALHHPPCSIGSNWMDQINLRNPDQLFAVLDRYDQVKVVLFGHIHQEFAATRAGVQYLGCPSTCVQFKPYQFDFALDQQQPGFRLLTLYPDGQVDTTVKRVNYQLLPNLAATGY